MDDVAVLEQWVTEDRALSMTKALRTAHEHRVHRHQQPVMQCDIDLNGPAGSLAFPRRSVHKHASSPSGKRCDVGSQLLSTPRRTYS